MVDEMNDYLTLDEIKIADKSFPKREDSKEKDIATLEQVKDRLPDEAQRRVMEKIINSAKNEDTEVPKVINLVEAPESPEETDATNDKEAETQETSVDADSLDMKTRFVRKKINFNALDELYLEEAKNFVERYKAIHSNQEDLPKKLEDSFVDEVLNIPISCEEVPSVVCAVPDLEIESIGLPEDKVLAAMNKELQEDVLFSFITMNAYDSEVGDYVYDEETIGAVNSEYPISL